MVLFNHSLEFPKQSLEQINTPDGRYYKTEAGILLPSVTTILGKSPKPELLAWKQRVGEEEANKILKQAGRRGSVIHKIAEAYLLNDVDWKKVIMPFNLSTFLSIKPWLDDNIEIVYGIEMPLYSLELNTAGTTDLVAKVKSNLSIIDYKTSRYPKKKDHILNYFIQASCYAMMFNELYDQHIEDIIILMAIDHDRPSIFHEKVSNYQEKVLDIFNADTNEEFQIQRRT